LGGLVARDRHDLTVGATRLSTPIQTTAENQSLFSMEIPGESRSNDDEVYLDCFFTSKHFGGVVNTEDLYD